MVAWDKLTIKELAHQRDRLESRKFSFEINSIYTDNAGGEISPVVPFNKVDKKSSVAEDTDSTLSTPWKRRCAADIGSAIFL